MPTGGGACSVPEPSGPSTPSAPFFLAVSCFALAREEYTQSKLHDLSCIGAVCSFTLGKPLFVLKQLFAFSFSGSFLSAHPPPPRGGLNWMGYGWGLGRTAWWVPVAGCVAPTSCCWAGPGGSRDHAGVCPPPRPWPGPMDIACLCLSAPPPPWGGRDLSSCLVLSPPDQGGDACNYRLRALVSVTLWAVLPLLALFGV